jgi:hypothetical protein
MRINVMAISPQARSEAAQILTDVGRMEDRLNLILTGQVTGRGRPGRPPSNGAVIGTPGTRVMSEEAKNRIREAQKARWAKHHAAQAKVEREAKKAAKAKAQGSLRPTAKVG